MKISGQIVNVQPFEVLFVVGNRRAWLPREHIRNLDEIRRRPEYQNFPEGIPVHLSIVLNLPRWLAEKKFPRPEGRRGAGAQ